MQDICKEQHRTFHQKLLVEIMATFLKEMPFSFILVVIRQQTGLHDGQSAS